MEHFRTATKPSHKKRENVVLILMMRLKADKIFWCPKESLKYTENRFFVVVFNLSIHWKLIQTTALQRKRNPLNTLLFIDWNIACPPNYLVAPGKTPDKLIGQNILKVNNSILLGQLASKQKKSFIQQQIFSSISRMFTYARFCTCPYINFVVLTDHKRTHNPWDYHWAHFGECT